MPNINKHLILMSIAGCVIAGSVPAAEVLNYPQVASIEIPNSKGKFDFLRVDEKRQRLLAAHENDGTSDYIDLKTHSLIKRLKVGGAVDNATDADSKFYYVSVQEDKRVAVVDAEKLIEVKSIPVAGPTDAIIFEPKNQMVYVTEDEGSHVFVIDPKFNKVAATVDIPGVPEFMLYDAEHDKIYLNIKDKDVVAVIDPATQKTIGQWPTGAAKQPHGMALDSSKHLIYVAGGNGMLVAIDTASGKTTDSITIAEKVDQIAMDAAGGLIYCAGPEKMSVISSQGAKLRELGYLTTAATARNVTVDPGTRTVWTTYTDGKNAYAKGWMPPK